MSIFDKAGGVILFACAIPLLLLEEARALASVKDDLRSAREAARRWQGERDEARREASARQADAWTWRSLLADERAAHAEAKRAAVELQAEVDRARAERDRANETARELRALITEAKRAIVAEFPASLGYSLLPSVTLLLSSVASLRTELDVADKDRARMIREATPGGL